MISVVVRAKNEAFWIGRCLWALRRQRLPDLDLILVDNDSTDETVAIARRYDVNLLTISRHEFSYGRALNRGIAAARHDVVAMISAHCVPVDDLWADYMRAHLGPEGDPAVCGVYGRQEPMPDSTSIDKRDLWTTFREDRVRQKRDYYFHNANSGIRKSDWERLPFDEALSGVEDQAWAKRMVAAGRVVVYEPMMRVYHHHGIHQGRDEGRAKRVAEVIETIQNTPA